MGRWRWRRIGRRGSLGKSRIEQGERRRRRTGCRRGGRAVRQGECERVRKGRRGLTRRLAEEVELEETR